MKKTITFLFLSCFLTSCGILFPWPEGNYPITTFYVKNDSEKAINFQSTVIKQSTITGRYEMTVPFTVRPKDSVLARQIGFKKYAEPQKWFTKFIIFPVDGIEMNDPNKPENWKKGTNSKGKPFYTFLIAE